MTSKLITIFSLSTALVLSANVSAHEEDGDIRFQRVGYFDDVDTNQDGKVSRDEYLAYNSDSRHYDRDWRENHWDEMTEKFDSDGDNQITTAEVEEYVEEKVAEVSDRLKNMKWLDDKDFDFDFDGHNYVFDFDDHDFHGDFDFDKDEFAQRFSEKMKDLHERIEDSIRRLDDLEIRGLDDDRIFAFRSAPRFEIKRRFRFDGDDLDSNGDGVVSEEEFLSDRGKLFDRLDKNGDGVLDEDELDRYPFKGDLAFEWHDEDYEDDE